MAWVPALFGVGGGTAGGVAGTAGTIGSTAGAAGSALGGTAGSALGGSAVGSLGSALSGAAPAAVAGGGGGGGALGGALGTAGTVGEISAPASAVNMGPAVAGEGILSKALTLGGMPNAPEGLRLSSMLGVENPIGKTLMDTVQRVGMNQRVPPAQPVNIQPGQVYIPPPRRRMF